MPQMDERGLPPRGRTSQWMGAVAPVLLLTFLCLCFYHCVADHNVAGHSNERLLSGQTDDRASGHLRSTRSQADSSSEDRNSSQQFGDAQRVPATNLQTLLSRIETLENQVRTTRTASAVSTKEAHEENLIAKSLSDWQNALQEGARQRVLQVDRQNLVRQRARQAIDQEKIARVRLLVEMHNLGYFESAPQIAQNGGRAWGPEQASGPPDTDTPGDIETAWAPKEADDGRQWLRLYYDRRVNLGTIAVFETFNPGAISEVVAVLPDQSELVIWQGQDQPPQVEGQTLFAVPPNVRVDSVIVYLDTDRVSGWNEIDTVGLVGRNGATYWPTAAASSTSYAER